VKAPRKAPRGTPRDDPYDVVATDRKRGNLIYWMKLFDSSWREEALTTLLRLLTGEEFWPRSHSTVVPESVTSAIEDYLSDFEELQGLGDLAAARELMARIEELDDRSNDGPMITAEAAEHVSEIERLWIEFAAGAAERFMFNHVVKNTARDVQTLRAARRPRTGGGKLPAQDRLRSEYEQLRARSRTDADAMKKLFQRYPDVNESAIRRKLKRALQRDT
jgi:hypothetical protein